MVKECATVEKSVYMIMGNCRMSEIKVFVSEGWELK